jgi:hypothetical protein
VSRLLQLFIDICLFRARPQDLPTSRFLLVASIVVSLVIRFFPLLNYLKGFYPALLASLLDTVLILLFLRGGLYFLEKERRFLQTATAIFGTKAVLSIPLLFVELMILSAPSEFTKAVGAAFYLPLMVWSITVTGHILRHALEIRFAGGIAVAVVYSFLIILLMNQFLPVGL